MGEPQSGANLQTKRGLIRPRELPGNQVTVALVQIHLTDSRTETEIQFGFIPGKGTIESF